MGWWSEGRGGGEAVEGVAMVGGLSGFCAEEDGEILVLCEARLLEASVDGCIQVEFEECCLWVRFDS